MWVDMREPPALIDVGQRAPQKGWDGSTTWRGTARRCSVARAARPLGIHHQLSSFACDLKVAADLETTTESGGHAYRTAMPADALAQLRDVMQKPVPTDSKSPFRAAGVGQQGLRALFESRGIASVAADGFEAQGVVVSYTTDPALQNSQKCS